MKSKRCLLVIGMCLSFPTGLFAQTSVSGRVVFEGAAPPAEQVDVKSDIATCGTTQEVHHLILGQDGGVKNAVITILGAKGEAALAPQEGRLDQVKCEFQPHVQVLPVGSTLKITSSDPVLHNSHGFNEDGSTAFNIAVPIAGMELPTKIKQPGVIKLRCDAGHTWMSAYVVGVDHLYYAITDENGNFTIQNVPPGDYEIEVWQEWLGISRQPITVKEGSEPTTITLKKS
ncbi:MAG: hypothetical protein HY584_01425 [Candidatus Omnitrophica bacterium]|nr:hypothetical protein [Candidatus Omnitrophota bacterium]